MGIRGGAVSTAPALLAHGCLRLEASGLEPPKKTGEMAEPDQVRVDFQPELQETQPTSGQISS